MALALTALLHLFLASTARCQYDTKEITVDPAKHDEEFFSFHSRPDIEAPRWESHVYNKSALAPGYWFLSPYGIVEQTTNDHEYVAPVIYDPKNGELIWNGGREVDYFNVFNVRVVKYLDQNMLSFIQPSESQGVIMNNHYDPIRHVRVGTIAVRSNMHDFQIVDDGTKALYLTNIHRKVSPETALALGYDGVCEVVFVGIEERDLDTDRMTFTWDSEPWVPLSESYSYPVPEGYPQYNIAAMCNDGFGVDYIHGNSIEKLPDGDYLLSSRHMYAIYKISHVDGSIVWRLGGKNSDFAFDEGTHFSAQHDARCTFQNETHMTITMMDNAVGVWEDVGYTSNPNSRGLVLSLNTETMVASEVAHYDHPGGVGAYAFERGNMQTLPGGNVFLTWTLNAQHSEYTADGTLIAEAKILSPLKTYRSFKFPWVGHRRQKPDVFAEVVEAGIDGELQTLVRVSWNGDTQATQWNLYGTDAHGAGAQLLNTTAKAGFETTMTYKGYMPFVKVDAVDRSGAILKDSASDAMRTVFLPDAEAIGILSSIARTGAWSSLGDMSTDPVVLFLGGILFGILSLLGIRRIRWPNTLQRMRRQVRYSALGDDEEKRGWLEEGGLLRESDDDNGKKS